MKPEKTNFVNILKTEGTLNNLPTLDYSKKLRLLAICNQFVSLNIPICAVKGKAPNYTHWERGISLEQLDNHITSGYTGYGILTGNDYIAIDIDGYSALELFNQIYTGEAPDTLTWSSGREGRKQMLFKLSPEQRADNLKTIKIVTSAEDKEQLEFRYTGCQSVMPPSIHPVTLQEYQWVNGYSPTELTIAELPNELYIYWKRELDKENLGKELKQCRTYEAYNRKLWEYLEFDIITHYQGKPVGNDEILCCSPMRQDKNPSFTVNYGDKLLGYDLATEESYQFFDIAIKLGYKIKKFSKPYKPISEDNHTIIREKLELDFNVMTEITNPIERNIARELLFKKYTSLGLLRETLIMIFRDYSGGKHYNYLSDLKSLASQSMSRFELNPKLNLLSKNYGIGISQAYFDYQEINKQLELEDYDLKSEIDFIRNTENEDLNLIELLPEKLAQPLINLAKNKQIKQVNLLLPLLTIMGSFNMVYSKLELFPDTNWEVKSNLFFGLMGESGQIKSPIVDVFISPLAKIRSENLADYAARKRHYDAELNAYTKLKKNERDDAELPKIPYKDLPYIDSATTEGLQTAISERTREEHKGILYFKEELTGLITELNQYKSTGSDRQFYLELFNAQPFYVQRSDDSKSRNVAASCTSLLGTLQPEKLKLFLSKNKNDDDGFLARFLLSSEPTKPRYLERNNNNNISIFDMLYHLYKKALKFADIQWEDFAAVASNESKHLYHYRLSNDALNQFLKINNEIEAKANTPGVWQPYRVFLSKLKGLVGRIALNLHVINHLFLADENSLDTIPTQIELETIDAAYRIAKYCARQVKALYSDICADDYEIAPILSEIIKISLKKPEHWCSASDLKRSNSSKFAGKNTPDKIREYFVQLKELGYGETQGEGKKLKFRALSSPNNPNHTPKNPNPDNQPNSSDIKRKAEGNTPKFKKGDRVLFYDYPYEIAGMTDTGYMLYNPEVSGVPIPADFEEIENRATLITGEDKPEWDDSGGDDKPDNNPDNDPDNEPGDKPDKPDDDSPGENDPDNEPGDKPDKPDDDSPGEYDPEGNEPNPGEEKTEGNEPGKIAPNRESSEVQNHLATDSDKKPDLRTFCQKSKSRIDVNEEVLPIFKADLSELPALKEYPCKPYSEVTKFYFDIETTGLEPETSELIAIGVLIENSTGELIKHIFTGSEREQLLSFGKLIKEHNPEIIAGHNIFKFDLPYIHSKLGQHKIKSKLAKDIYPRHLTSANFYGYDYTFNNFTYPNVSFVDTYQLAGCYDKAASCLPGYRLKDLVLYFDKRTERRLELSANEIKEQHLTGDLSQIKEYLTYDLEDTKSLSDIFTPQVWLQQRFIPMSAQAIAHASPAKKWEVILEKYYGYGYTAKLKADDKVNYQGAYVACSPGYYENVSKIDVSSMYPYIMLQFGLNTSKDKDNYGLGALQEFLNMKSEYKTKYKQTKNSEDKAMIDVSKVLINGYYGFCGTGGYKFNDIEAATLVTAYGRKLIKVIEGVLLENNATIIEIDTDGIYYSYQGDNQELLNQVNNTLPELIKCDLDEFDCDAYFSKMKNYILFTTDGVKATGATFKSRATYNLKKEFTIDYLKAYSIRTHNSYWDALREQLNSGKYPIEELTITKKIGKGEKALLAIGSPGDKVSFYWGSEGKYTRKGVKYIRKPVTTGAYYPGFYIEDLAKVKAEIDKVLGL